MPQHFEGHEGHGGLSGKSPAVVTTTWELSVQADPHVGEGFPCKVGDVQGFSHLGGLLNIDQVP